MAPASTSFGGGGDLRKRNNGLCQHFYPAESCPSQISPWCQTIQFLSICAWWILNCWPSAGAQSKWALWEELPGTTGAFHLTQPQSSLVFTARNHGNISSWHWNPGLRGTVWNWDTSILTGDFCSQDISSYFYLPHVSVGPAHSTSLPLLPVLMWILL